MSQGCYASENARCHFEGMQDEDYDMQNEGQGYVLDLVRMLKVGVHKVDYARDSFLGLIMMFRLCKMMIGDQEDKLVDGQFDRV